VTEKTLNILVYSDDAHVREQVRMALGTKLAPELPKLSYVEVATEPVVIQKLDQGNIDLVILDAEAAPAGGMGIARQLKDEIFNCPPVMVLIARPQDAWLATWSKAEAVVQHPIDPVLIAEAAATLIRRRLTTTLA
jgi:DNA-binding response OmpR family regulator